MAPESEGLDLTQILSVLRRRAWLIVLCTVVVAAAAFAFSKMQQKEYEATSALTFGESRISKLLAALPSSSSTGSQLAEQASNIQLVAIGPAAEKTAKQIGGGLTATEVSKAVSVNGSPETEVVAITATSTSPDLAARIANSYAEAFVESQAKANAHFLTSALALVRHQLDKLPRGQRFGSAAVDLQNRAQTLQLLRELNYNDVRVVQTAVPPTYASSPNTKKNTAIGVVLGLLLGLGLAFAIERFRRGRSLAGAGEIESVYGLPLLGNIPVGADPEAFALLRARLRFASGGGDTRLVFVAAASRGDGATTICRGLAEAAARSGARVIIVETDLREPTLTRALALGSGPRLEQVLSGGSPLRNAIQAVAVQGVPGGGRLSFDVLAPGQTPLPSPGQWIESPAMELVLGQLRSEYDLVLVDAPPLTAYADGFLLLAAVDGVLVVSRVGHSERELAERLRGTLRASGARLLGVVANGTGRRSPATPAATEALHGPPPALRHSSNGAGSVSGANGAGSGQPTVSPVEN